MKFQVLVSSLPLIISLANAQAATAAEHYAEICPANDGQEREIQPGLFATYQCDKATALGVVANSNPATDPDACVLACEQTIGCVGSMWSARPGAACWLVQHQGEPNMRDKTEVAYITYRREEDNDPFPDPPEDPFPEPDCEEQCEARLNALRTPKCPAVHEQQRVRGGKTYKTWCNHDLKGATVEFYEQNDRTFDQCLDMCSTQSQCKGVLWYPLADLPCKLHAQSFGKGKWVPNMVIAAHKQQ